MEYLETIRVTLTNDRDFAIKCLVYILTTDPHPTEMNKLPKNLLELVWS